MVVSQQPLLLISSSGCLSPLNCVALNPSQPSSPIYLPLKPYSKTPLLHVNVTSETFSVNSSTTRNHGHFSLQRVRTRATLDEKDPTSSSPLIVQEEEEEEKEKQPLPNKGVEESVKLLKKAAKTRNVGADEILSAFSAIEKAKVDPSGFLDALGGSKSPGRTWMLIFTAERQLKSGRYFPLTAVQRFDASAKRIENGVYLGPIGSLTFEGRFSWKNRILSFIFECIRVKIGPLNPLGISLGKKEDREPSTKDPFFIWFYIDEEIAVARGRSGGTAFWCRCSRITA